MTMRPGAFQWNWLLSRSVVIAMALAVGVGGCDRSAPGGATQQNSVSAAASKTAATQQPPAAPARPQRPHDPYAPPASPILGSPPIKFDPPLLDLGVVRPNQKLSSTINIQSVSDEPLKIVWTKASCTCTSVDLSNTIIAPGQSIPMHADYHSGSTMGDKKSSIRVQVEGYDIVAVDLQALVALPVRAEPSFITSQPEPGVAVLAGEYTVDSMDKRPFTILAVNGGPVPYADGFDPARDQPRNMYRLKWDLSRYNSDTCLDAQGNRLPAWVTIETDHPECPIIDLEVRHQCAKRPEKQDTDTWFMQDKRVLIGGVKPGAYADFEVLAKWIRPRINHDLISSAVSESNQFSGEILSVERVSDGMLCKVRVTVAADQTALIYGTLRLRSANQSFPLIIVGTAR